jgi:hypothetical protein
MFRSMARMSSLHYIRKVSALVAASLILPALAYADHDNDKNSYRDDRGRCDKDDHHWNKPIPHAPEANAGWVLIPFFGAVLLFSARNLFRGKVTE